MLYLGSVQRVFPESRSIPAPASSACTGIQDMAVPQARALLLEWLHSSSFPLFPLPDVPPDPLAPLSGLQHLLLIALPAQESRALGWPWNVSREGGPRMSSCGRAATSVLLILPGELPVGEESQLGARREEEGLGGWKCPPSWGNRHLPLRMTS